MLDQFEGQKHILDSGKIISSAVEKGAPFSMIFWGGPGTGKTTLARILAERFSLDAHYLSAVSAGVADVRKVIETGKKNRADGVKTLLFLDEIHRFNKAQQDSVLGSVEAGDIILIGATTENPSFSVIAPLLSRARVIRFNPLDDDEMRLIVGRAVETDEILTAGGVRLDPEAADLLINISGGDARRALNILESSFLISGDGHITPDQIFEAVKSSVLYYDKAGDRHYDTISAFIKSIRGSDPDAAVYYLAKMILSGEDPEFIARRMVISASEDVGNASPTALTLAVSAMTAVKNIGFPEAEIILAQCAVFLACSPKSNASYLAVKKAKEEAAAGEAEIPMHIRNAPTGMMKDMGYGKGYKYPHDYPGHFVDESYLPDKISDRVFYNPTEEGTEKQISDRLKRLWPRKYGK
jgi:putative ATPase